MKYETYITDSDLIFWTKNSVDKPTQKYFNYLMKWITWNKLGDISPNFENQFNGSLVVDKDTYTYVKLVNTETNEIKYYSIDRISKILSKGFVIDITLDVFTTYGLDFYSKLKGKSVKVNRSTMAALWKKEEIYYQDDELLSFTGNYYLYKNRSVNQSGDKRITIGGNENEKTIIYFYKMFSNTEWVNVENKGLLSITTNNKTKYYYPYIIAYKFGFGCLYENAIFDVYQDVDGNYFIVPIFGKKIYNYIETDKFENETSSNSLDWFFEIQMFDVDVDGVQHTQKNGSDRRKWNVKFWNYEEKTNRIKDNTFWVNKYKGRFYIPLWIELINQSQIVAIDLNDSKYSNDEGNNWVLMFKIPNGINKIYSSFYNYYTSTSIYVTNSFKRNSKHINTYVASKVKFNDDFTFNYLNNTVGNDKVECDIGCVKPVIGTLLYGTLSYSFNQNTGFKWFTSSNILSFGYSSTGTLPTSTSEYQSYLAGVNIQQNTSLDIAKQQRDLGIFNSIFSSASQGLIAMGQAGINPLFAAGTAVNALNTFYTGVSNNVLQYENKKRTIDAQRSDKLRSSTANNLVSSNEKDNIANRLLITEKSISSGNIDLREFDNLISTNDFLYINKNNVTYLKDTNKLYNDIIWNSGYKINNVVTFSWTNANVFDDGVNPFLYWDIEIPNEWIKQTYNNYNNELISAIETVINNPVRFWKAQPNYDATLTIGWVKGD